MEGLTQSGVVASSGQEGTLSAPLIEAAKANNSGCFSPNFRDP